MSLTSWSRTVRFAAVASLFGVAAGVTELAVGTSRWTGNKDDPTTLGLVTIGLALGLLVAALVAERMGAPGVWFGTGLVMLMAASLGMTTAGAASFPAFVFGVTSGVMALRTAQRQRPLRALLAELWPVVLLVVLAANYLAFGIVAGGVAGLLGLLGGLAVGVALLVRRRSRPAAAIVLIAGTLPFAGAAAWTVVVPLAAVLILAVGLPLVHATPEYGS